MPFLLRKDFILSECQWNRSKYFVYFKIQTPIYLVTLSWWRLKVVAGMVSLGDYCDLLGGDVKPEHPLVTPTQAPRPTPHPLGKISVCVGCGLKFCSPFFAVFLRVTVAVLWSL